MLSPPFSVRLDTLPTKQNLGNVSNDVSPRGAQIPRKDKNEEWDHHWNTGQTEKEL